MRLAGSSARSYGLAIMRSLKAQPVFSSKGTVRRPRNELILHSRKRIHDSGSTGPVRYYIAAISKERRKRSGFTGFSVSFVCTYETNVPELQALIDESLPRINEAEGYNSLTWHDVAVLLTLEKLYSRKTEMGRFARAERDKIIAAYPLIQKYTLKYFM